MLRSAEEIAEDFDIWPYEEVGKAINKARKEALEKAKELMGTEFDKAIIDKLISEIK